MAPRVSLVMIVKDEEQVLARNLERWRPLVDEWVIVDTGSTDGTPQIIQQYSGQIRIVPFTNFVDTKNQALEMATGEWVLLADADEYLEDGGIERLVEYVATDLGQDIDAVSTLIIEKAPDLTVVQTYYRNRMWRNHGQRFVGPGVHEVIAESGKIVLDPSIRVWHDRRHRTGESYAERANFYVAILDQWLAEHPADPRALFYMGRTLKDCARFDEAISYYYEYLNSPSDYRDERWQAAYDIAECYRATGDYDQAILACKMSLDIDPRRAEALTMIGAIYYIQQRWEEAEGPLRQAMATPVPQDVTLFLNPKAHNSLPMDYLSVALYKMGRYSESAMLSGRLSQFEPKYDGRILSNIHVADNHVKSRLFFCLGETPEPVWGDMIATHGMGGVETTYLELPKALAKLGMECFVFCRTQQEHVADGVYFIPQQNLDLYSGVDPHVIIASRGFDVFNSFPKAKHVVWLQDAHFSDSGRAEWITQADRVIVSSGWHRNYTISRYGHGIDPDAISVIPLGVRKEMFTGGPKDDRLLIYSSNPDRGLYDLIEMWDEITARVHDVKLVVTYGWQGLKTWNTDPEYQARIDKQAQEIQGWAASKGNVKLTGRIPKRELYRWMAQAALCAYPCNFWETFCLTAAECQISGTPLVTSRLGGLPYILDDANNVLIAGYPKTSSYRRRFVDSIVDLLVTHPKRLAEMQHGVREYASTNVLDWSDVARIWQMTIWTSVLDPG
jgi:glycosyltransferase involved in cell wall biosynthesis